MLESIDRRLDRFFKFVAVSISVIIVFFAIVLTILSPSPFGPATISFSQSELNQAQESNHLVFVSQNEVANIGKYLTWQLSRPDEGLTPYNVHWVALTNSPVSDSEWVPATIQVHKIDGDRYIYRAADLIDGDRRVQLISFDRVTGELEVLFGYPTT